MRYGTLALAILLGSSAQGCKPLGWGRPGSQSLQYEEPSKGSTEDSSSALTACACLMLCAVSSGDGLPGGGVPAPRGGGLPAPRGALPPAGLPPVSGGSGGGEIGGAGAGGVPVPGGSASSPGGGQGAASAARRGRFLQGLGEFFDAKPMGQVLVTFPECPLPDAQLRAIDDHPIKRLADALNASGRRVDITIEDYERTLDDLRRQSKVTGRLGALLRSRYLALVLQHLFPGANVHGPGWTAAFTGIVVSTKGTQRVYLQVRDDAVLALGKMTNESSPEAAIRKGERQGVVQMVLMKPVDTLNTGVSRASARNIFGLDDGAYVTHVYADGEMASNLVYQLLPKLIGGERPPKVVFFSTLAGSLVHGALFQLVKDNLAKVFQGRVRIELLSKLTRAEVKKDGTVIVLNDMKGVVPYLNAAADHLFVMDNGNPLEGLLSGTPTTLIRPPGPTRAYNEPMYQQYLAPVVRGSTAGRVVSSVDEALAGARDLELAVARAKAPGGPGVTPPYLVDLGDGRTPLRDFLDHLQRILQAKGFKP